MPVNHNTLEIGQLVSSISGRDHGAYYIVYAVDGNRVLLVDGRKRLTQNAKVKNPLHLQKTNLISLVFKEKVAQGKITPEDIRRCLSEMLVQS